MIPDILKIEITNYGTTTKVVHFLNPHEVAAGIFEIPNTVMITCNGKPSTYTELLDELHDKPVLFEGLKTTHQLEFYNVCGRRGGPHICQPGPNFRITLNAFDFFRVKLQPNEKAIIELFPAKFIEAMDFSK